MHDAEHEQNLTSLRVAMMQGGASALETAAMEMSQAAGALVAIEKHIIELSEQKVIAFSQLMHIQAHICTETQPCMQNISSPSTASEPVGNLFLQSNRKHDLS